MEIKYKFNKSSEARDCTVESVKLNISKKETIYEEFTKKVLDTLEKYCIKLENDYDIENFKLFLLYEL